ncbi:UNVERIFIED_CONTAM: hypothetical protein Sangu_2790000 [Sesamum angustifolium]|uniref:Uncharacterized protein n=1 Tax=Sesamum angustifolium TaxID=2727405 RepID=A0AAW2IRW8_9LAMI
MVRERFIESSSEFNDLSDEGYRQPDGEESEFDAPSIMLEDMEDISEDDTFLNKNPNKIELMIKLKMSKMMREQAKLRPVLMKILTNREGVMRMYPTILVT